MNVCIFQFWGFPLLQVYCGASFYLFLAGGHDYKFIFSEYFQIKFLLFPSQEIDGCRNLMVFEGIYLLVVVIGSQ